MGEKGRDARRTGRMIWKGAGYGRNWYQFGYAASRRRTCVSWSMDFTRGFVRISYSYAFTRPWTLIITDFFKTYKQNF
jgi:hypothetical protein